MNIKQINQIIKIIIKIVILFSFSSIMIYGIFTNNTVLLIEIIASLEKLLLAIIVSHLSVKKSSN